MGGSRTIQFLMVCLLIAAGGIWGVRPTSVAASGTSDQAVAYQMDVAHDGYLSGDTLAPPLFKQWSRSDLGGSVSYPLIAGGKVFVTVGGPITSTTGSYPPKWIYALDEATGATVWSQPISGVYDSISAAYDNGTVFVINHDGLLQSFDAGTGKPGWSLQMPGQYSFDSPLTAANGVVYVTGDGSGGTLYAVNESKGAVLWTRGLNTADHTSPALYGTSVFVSISCDVYAFNASDGTPLWTQYYGCSGGGGKTAVATSTGVYARQEGVPSSNDILDPQSGTVTGHFSAGPAPAFAGTTGFFMNNHTLQAVDSSGTVLWSFAGDGGLDTAPIIVNSDVYVGSSSGMLYAVDTGTGHAVWSDNVGAGILAPDEQNEVVTTGLGAGEGHLIVPAGSTLTAYVPQSADTTPPVIQPTVTGPQGANEWYTGAVSVSWSVSDPETRIVASTGCGSSTLSTNTAGTTLTCSATNGAGLSSSSSVTVRLDGTPPSVPCSSPPAGWSASDVSVSCAASDATSGLVNSSDTGFTLSTSVPSGSETSSASTGGHQVCDGAGNCSTAGPYGGLKVDKKAPAISLTAPSAGTYTLNQAVMASYSCTDGGSGVASCSGPIPSGQPVTTSSIGAKTFMVNATDNVGNAATPTSAAYTVTYGVCQSTVPAIKSGHAGSVTVKLCDASGANVSSPAIIVTASGIYSSAGVKVKALSNNFAYSSSNKSYTESIDTSGLGSGSYYVAFTANGDSVNHQATFAVK